MMITGIEVRDLSSSYSGITKAEYHRQKAPRSGVNYDSCALPVSLRLRGRTAVVIEKIRNFDIPRVARPAGRLTPRLLVLAPSPGCLFWGFPDIARFSALIFVLTPSLGYLCRGFPDIARFSALIFVTEPSPGCLRATTRMVGGGMEPRPWGSVGCNNGRIG